jgi:hypothetical protein
MPKVLHRLHTISRFLLAVFCSAVAVNVFAAGQSAAVACSDSQSVYNGQDTYLAFNDYRGFVDGKAIGFTLVFHGSKVDGQVFVAPDFHNIQVKGHVDTSGELNLSVVDKSKPNDNDFQGQFKDIKECDSFKGGWNHALAGIPPHAWNVSLTHTGSADVGKNYYSNLGVKDDRQIDDPALVLQRAILSDNKQAVARMVAYPVSVSIGRRQINIKNPQQFLKMYDHIFIPYMVNQVRTAVPHHMFTGDENGALFTSRIWLDTHGRLMSIFVKGEPAACATELGNSRSPMATTHSHAQKSTTNCKQFAGSLPPLNPGTYVTDFVCDASKYHIVVDSKADYVPRYRAWIKPHPMSSVPDMQINNGTETVQGTGVCAYSTWSFKKGDTQYSVRQLGCTDGSEPKNAVGKLDVLIHGKPRQNLWCMQTNQ